MSPRVYYNMGTTPLPDNGKTKKLPKNCCTSNKKKVKKKRE
jgi:hypothetical protein